MKRKLFLLTTFLFIGLGLVSAQVKKVTGMVTSADDGMPIIGASVLVDGTTVGTVTDFDGKYTIDNLPSGAKTVTVSYIGYKAQTLAIKAVLNVVLKSDTEQLDEVVVVAYGTQKKESLTGSVSIVDKKKIEKRVVSNVTSALEGATPGVQVNNTYGEPGAAPSIIIRGFGSVTGSNAPLYVVDGVPYVGNIAELNPSDIESLSVLKDAASSALYGNRAANGVVLITTKRGRGEAKPQITLKVNQGSYKRGLPEYDRLNANDWMEQSWIAMKNFAMGGKLNLTEDEAKKYASNQLIQDYVKRNIYNKPDKELFDADGNLVAEMLPGYTDLNWRDGVERTGHRQEYSLSASAATDKTHMFASVGYLKEEGYIVGSGYERYTARVNTDYTPNKYIKAGINANLTVSDRNFNDNASGSAFGNPFYIARYMAPVYPYYLHNEDGSIMEDEFGNKIYDTQSSYLQNRNIIYELNQDQQKTHRNVLGAQAFATFNLPYDISFTVKGDLNNSNSSERHYQNPMIGDGATNNGRMHVFEGRFVNYTAQELLNWNHEFGLHHVDVMAGHENYKWEAKRVGGMNTNMAVEGNYSVGNFLIPSSWNGQDDAYATESYLARARYNFDNIYFLEGSFRRDGSSRFHPDHRWGNFFSMGASWNMKREAWLKDVEWINMFKSRLSYGEVGNDAGVSLYAYKALYAIMKNGGDAALIMNSLGAKNIKWETTQTIDFAIEGRLFDRLSFTLGLFDKRSKDLLFDVRLPSSLGSFPWGSLNMTQTANIGTVSNRGVELSMNFDAVKSGDFTWNIGLDATLLKNEIKKLPDGKDIKHGLQNYSEGHSIYEWYTYHFEGVDQMTGRSLYTIDPDMKAKAEKAHALVNINGTDYVTQTSFAKRDWAGSALPDIYGSFSSSMTYKNFSLSMLMTYSLGGKTYDSAYSSLMSTSSASSASANHSDIKNSWNGVPEGMTADSPNRIDKNGIPRLDFNYSNDNNAASDRWLISSSYFVMKNINLSYSLPKTWLAPIGVNSVLLNAGVENLFTLTKRKGLNPQFSFRGGADDTYVTARVFNMGLTVKF